MADQVLLYRGGDLIVDDDVVLNSLDTASLLVGGINVRPYLVTKLTNALNINAAASNVITMDAVGDYNNMSSLISKTSTSVLTVGAGGAGTYLIYMAINVTASASSVQIQFLKGLSVIATANISPSDSAAILCFPIVLAAADTLNFNSVRVGANSTAKNTFGTSSSLVITKLA